MLKLFNRRKKTFTAPLAPDQRIYVVGDIHGRMDLLRPLMDSVLKDCKSYDGIPDVVFLGDYIDRGENSREVLEFLIDLGTRQDVAPVFLMGNHERMLLDFFESPELGTHWLNYGGLQTLASYGVAANGMVTAFETLENIQADLAEAMGSHYAFVKQMALSHRRGNVFFAHAGANPTKNLLDQTADSLLWGNPKFYHTMREDGIWVVHGHTVVEEPMAVDGRISVDTGAYFTNRLTAARIDNGAVEFISAT